MKFALLFGITNICYKMATRRQTIFQKYNTILEQMGENIKLARKRRKLTMVQVVVRADITSSTLHLIESGKPSVAMGAYFNVFGTLGLQVDFLKLATGDILGRKLQDIELLKKFKFLQINGDYRRQKKN